MWAFIMVLIWINTVIACSVNAFFVLRLLKRNDTSSHRASAYFNSRFLLLTCEIAAVVFSVLFWLYASMQTLNICEQLFRILGVCTGIIGFIWLVLAAIAVLVSIIQRMTQESTDELVMCLSIVKKSFVFGLLFLLCGLLFS